MNRHLLSAADLTRDDASWSSTPPRRCARSADRPIKKLPTLRGRTVVNLFFEDSTRTRISFEAAAKRLSADVINFSAKGSSCPRASRSRTPRSPSRRWAPTRSSAGTAPAARRTGSPLRLGTRQRGQRRRRHARAPDPGAARRLHDARAGSGGLDGLRVAIVGDVLHSRVARSNVLLLHTLGAEVTLVAPPTLLPVGIEAWPVEIVLRPRRGAAQGRRGDDAAGPARADERRVLPDRPASTAGATASTADARGHAARPRDRHAPRPDGARHGDHRRRRRRRCAR